MIILTLLALMGRVKLLWRNLLLPLDSQSVSRPRLPPIIKIYRQEKRFLLKIKIWLLKATQLLVPKNAVSSTPSCLPLTFDPALPINVINVIYQSNYIYATNQYELKDFSRRVGTVDSEVRFVTAVTAMGSVNFFASDVNFSVFTQILCFYHQNC